MKSIVLEEILSLKGPLAGEHIIDINPISGGCIHDAWKLKLQTGQELFAKTCQKENFAMLEFESNCLIALNEAIDQNFLKVPKPIMTQELESNAILILPWLNLKEGNEEKLGKGLALLHKESSKTNQNMFGWGNDGFIGYNQQLGGWEQSWGKCFVNLRIEPQIKMAKKWGLDFSLKNFYSRLIKFLNAHNPQPSLVHGDLWKGNTAVTEKSQGVIFDPAVWWADREVDMGMTKLFGGFSKDFYNAYQETWPMPCGYEDRIDIYNLYHVLNHANLFGGNYKQQSLTLLKKISNSLEKY